MTATIQVHARQVEISAGRLTLQGEFALPQHALALVAFAHGSGSSRFSPRNQMVAEELHRAGIGTLLFDLLTETESQTRANVFDLPLLAERLLAASGWLAEEPDTRDLPLGYFGASTGAGAALIAAAMTGDRVRAVVSRGGRPDLARDYLAMVRTPTLLIVGGLDTAVLGLNRLALDQLRCPKRLAVVPGATHLFEEPGTLQAASHLARDWFVHYLPIPSPAHG